MKKLSKEEQTQVAEFQAELTELMQFKEQPYYKRLTAWVDAQRDELCRGVESSADPHLLMKASGGMKVLSTLMFMLNQEQLIRDQLTTLLSEAEDE